MDDMHPFERQVAAEVVREMRPSRAVDAVAVIAAVDTVRAPKWRFQTMFSALKLAVAVAIVALFGGFMLAGVTMQQPSDEPLPPGAASASVSPEVDVSDQSVRPDLLPGVDLVIEEVEPGVYRVLRDGAGHDLVAEPPRELVFAPDGDLVLFFRSDGAQPGVSLDGFYTLGETGGRTVEGIGIEDAWFDAAIDQADNLFVALDDRLESFDGDTWVELTWPNGDAGASAVEVGPDGAIWIARCSFGPSPRVARIDGDAWTVLPVPEGGTSGRYCNGTPAHLGIATDGAVWFAADPTHDGVPTGRGLLRFDGRDWVVPELPVSLGGRGFGPLAIGPDGSLWVYADERMRRNQPPALLRLQDGEWSVFTEEDGLPRPTDFAPFISWLAVDGEGTAWMAIGDVSAADGESAILPSTLPHRLHSFDGSTWKQYLTSHDVHRVAVASDGSVWATTVLRECDGQAGPCELEAAGLYVITPEVVAGTD